MYSSERNNCKNDIGNISRPLNANVNSIVNGNTCDKITGLMKEHKSPQHQKDEPLSATTPLTIPSIPLCIPEGEGFSERLLPPTADITSVSSSGRLAWNYSQFY
jgi:hypothetical protein